MPKKSAPAALRAQTEKRSAKLAFGSRASYSIEELESGTHTRQELRAEYSRLRSIAKKRFERLAVSEFATKNQKTPYNYTIEHYPTLKEIDEKDLPALLRDLAAVVESRRSRIYGLEDIRAESVATMQAEGYNWVTKENWLEFSDFMAVARTMISSRMFDSDRAVDIFAKNKRKGGTEAELLDAFQSWVDQQNAEVDNIPGVKR